LKLLGYPSLLLKTLALLYCSVTGCLTKCAPYSIMYKEEKVYVPKDEKLRAEIIRLYHDMPIGGHRRQ